ncbi:MAG: hypothetical protein JRJ45_00280 [Deltaproteobacteria bacterium]|nr:hypothetical protein [Deltaproteobacteria bacterium]
MNITNQQFLESIFGALWQGCHVTSFSTTPNDAGVLEWAGKYAFQSLAAGELENPSLNNYFTVSLFKPDENNKSRRRKADFWAQYCIVIDDVGTGVGAKISPEMMVGKPLPSWSLETSPDNYQLGYKLDIPCSDADLLVRLTNALIEQGLMVSRDPGMRGVTRYVRTPVGINNKPAYGPGGFQCVLTEWNPDRVYSVDQIISGWGLVLAEPGAAIEGSATRVPGEVKNWDGDDPEGFDLVERTLEIAGLRGVDQGNGYFGCPCPQEDQHTIDDGRSGYSPSEGYSCFHGSCQDLSRGDLVRWLREEYPEAYEEAGDERARNPEYVENMFGAPLVQAVVSPEGVVSTVNQQGQIVNIGPRENTLPWFVERAGTLSSGDEDNPAMQRLLLDSVAHLKNTELEYVYRAIAESTGLSQQAIKSDAADAKKELRRNGVLPGGGTTLVVDNAGATDVVAVQGTGGTGPGFLPQLAVGQYLDTYEDTVITADRVAPKQTSANLNALMGVSGIQLWFNLMTKKTEIHDWGRYGFNEADSDNAMTRMEDLAIRCGMSDRRVRAMTRELAMRNSYHPLVSYLDGVQWDGVDRFAEVIRCITLVAGGGRPAANHFEVILKRWLTSIVAAVYGYGKYPPRGVLTFVGNQYIGKTSFLKKLAPQIKDSFKEGIHLSLSSNNETDSVRKSTTALVVELGELDATFRKSDIAALKAFIGRDTDEYRLPYGTDFIEWKRQTVFAASVNESEFLQDSTGNTRFWTCAVDRIDLDQMAVVDNVQLWAQVKQWYDQGEPWTMSQAEMVGVETVNAAHREITLVEEELMAHFCWDDGVYMSGKPWNSETGRGENHVVRMTTRGVARKLGMEDQLGNGRSKFDRDLVSAIKRLSGMSKPHMTKLNNAVIRMWYLPPGIDYNGNIIPFKKKQ